MRRGRGGGGSSGSCVGGLLPVLLLLIGQLCVVVVRGRLVGPLGVLVLLGVSVHCGERRRKMAQRGRDGHRRTLSRL